MTQDEAVRAAHELLGPSKCGPFTFDESGKSGRHKALCQRLQARELEHARDLEEERRRVSEASTFLKLDMGIPLEEILDRFVERNNGASDETIAEAVDMLFTIRDRKSALRDRLSPLRPASRLTSSSKMSRTTILTRCVTISQPMCVADVSPRR